MGYNTDWYGSLELNRKLTRAEQQEWDNIVENRHDSEYGYGDPKREYPSIWCNFVVEGDEFMWNGSEKTYEGYGWILFFLKWTKEKSMEYGEDMLLYAEGEMSFKGEDESDIGRVIVVYDKDNRKYSVEEEVAEIEYRYSKNDTQTFKEGGKLKHTFEGGLFQLNIGWFYYKHKKFIYEAIKKIENESKPGVYDKITDSKEVYDNVQGPFKNIIKEVEQTVDMVFRVTEFKEGGTFVRGIKEGGTLKAVPVVDVRIRLYYSHKQGGSNGYSVNYIYKMGGKGKNRWIDPTNYIYETKSYAEVEEFKKGGTLKVKGRSWYEAGGMVKQAQQMRRFKEEMDNSIRQAKNEIEQSKRSIEKSKQNLVDSADNIKKEERSIKENIAGMRQDAKEAQEFERRARKYKRGGKTYSRENRPSPSKSATIFNVGYRSRGNDGNIWEVKENIKGTHRWVKLKG